MANLREELAAALPGLQKAVFSQPADKLSDQKVTVRPVRIKGKLSYQVERFRDNKAFHQNLDGLEGIRDLHYEKEGAVFLYSGRMELLLNRLAQSHIRDLTITEPDLEEIFMHYYEKGGHQRNGRVIYRRKTVYYRESPVGSFSQQSG